MKPVFQLSAFLWQPKPIVILIAAKIARRITVNVYDSEEKPFIKRMPDC